MIKVLFLFLPVAITFALTGNAQTNSIPEKSIGVTFGDTGNDRGVHVIKTSDNNLVTVGVTETVSNSEDILVVKTDLFRNKLWEKKFGGNKDDAGWDIAETDGGENYLISGWSNSYSRAGDEDILLLKVSKEGNVVWSKSLINKGAERCWSFKKLNSGDFILVGQTQNITTRNMKGLITKVDREGNLQWQYEYGDAKYNRLFYCDETKTQDILVAGITRNDSTAENNGWVILVDKNGRQKSQVQLTAKRNITTHGILSISKNEILVYGYAQTDTARNQRSIYLSMFDTEGNLKWEKVTNDKESNNHGIGAIVTSSGSILLVGYSRPLYTGKWDGVIYKFSKKGEMKWRKLFGGNEADKPYGIVEISKNKFVVTGLTKSSGNGGEDMWLVWVDENGRVLD